MTIESHDQRISPCLWFNSNALGAAEFYVSIFDHSRILEVSHYGEASSKASGQPEGTVMTVTFELDGQPFMGLNGGPHFTFSPAISFIVYCQDQEEIDTYWEKLLEGGEESQCGWLTDKFGVSWQIVPAGLDRLIMESDKETSEQVMAALMGMRKIILGELEEAGAKT